MDSAILAVFPDVAEVRKRSLDWIMGSNIKVLAKQALL
jgi:hypothetical protein